MNALTPLGLLHTAISLVAVAAGFYALARHRQVAWTRLSGRIYVWATLLTCLTGFGIFQHGGFGKPHALGLVTLVVLGGAFLAERRTWDGGLWRVVAPVAYTFTLFLHMIPGFTETFTRLPAGAPLFAGPDDPALQALIGVVFTAFAVGMLLQAWTLRGAPPLMPSGRRLI